VVEPADGVDEAVEETGGIAVARMGEGSRRDEGEDGCEGDASAHGSPLPGPTVPLVSFVTAGLLAPDFPLRLPSSQTSGAEERMNVRYSRGGGAGIECNRLPVSR
jgi:hypothetical protein